MNTTKLILRIVTVFLVLFACVLPIALFIGVPIVREWRIQQSIKVPDGAKYMFDNLRQYSGSYKQKNLYYWSEKSIPEARQYYQDFTKNPLIEVNSNNESWFIAAWEGSKTIENPVRKVTQLSADLCDYREVFDCMTVMLFDAAQPSLPNILRGMFDNKSDVIQSLSNAGTLIVFSYYIPDPS